MYLSVFSYFSGNFSPYSANIQTNFTELEHFLDKLEGDLKERRVAIQCALEFYRFEHENLADFLEWLRDKCAVASINYTIGDLEKALVFVFFQEASFL